MSPASTNRINACVSSREVELMMIEAGHVGLVVSSQAHETLWPDATRWLAERVPLAAAASAPTVGALTDRA